MLCAHALRGTGGHPTSDPPYISCNSLIAIVSMLEQGCNLLNLGDVSALNDVITDYFTSRGEGSMMKLLKRSPMTGPSVPILLLLSFSSESMAAHRTTCRKVVKFGTLVEDSPNIDHSKNNLTCTVSLHAECGKSVTTELLVDTGSAVSILPEHLYRQHFSNTSLTVPNVHLALFYVVPGGTPLLGMDLFTALHLDIRDGSVASSAENGEVAVNLTEPLDLAAGFVHKVKVHSDVPPVQQKLCRLPFAVKDAVSQELKRLESEGIIEKVDSSPWVSSLLVIQKKSGGIRLCVDLREPKKAVIIDSHPLPHIEEVFTELCGASMFSTIDLQNVYHQVTLHQDSRDLTAFVTHDGLYRFTLVPYGLASAPSAFERMMSQDDVLAVQDGLHPNPDHVLAIQQSPPPHDAQSLHSFLRIAGWYSKFIPNYATLVEPLRALLRKSTGFCWTDEAQEYFNRLKQLITTSPVLALFDPSLPTTVTTDGSDFGIGAVLTQSHGTTERTVAFASRKFQIAKGSTLQQKKRPWCVFGRQKSGVPSSEAANLLFALTTVPCPRCFPQRVLNAQALARWSASLLCFNYSMKYKPGQDNVTADCLSRLPLSVTDDNQEQEPETVAVLSPEFAAVTVEELKSTCDACPILQQVKACIEKGWPRSVKSSAIAPYHRLWNELSVHDGYIIRGTHRVISPEALQSKFIQLAHTTHQRMHNKTAITHIAPLCPVDKLAIDVVGPLNNAPQGCRFAMTLIDYYSKWPEVVFAPDVTSANVVNFLSAAFS
ncbi:Retrovirus-related Pol polyprotein [Labeo rohita]|uniref:ribonuclease H n=1 Tax=Labeo rohita TaxID=84645 RepID=A0ABQ8M7C0_LABRO|nr:Retrovirus-related Pol polyprotein [Labeo rohita]